ncbi:VWA domain-containing protein, partial [Methylobacterium goesingense]
MSLLDTFLGTCAILRPWWLVAIPLVAALALRAAWRSAPLGDWTRAVDPGLMALLARRGAVLG